MKMSVARYNRMVDRFNGIMKIILGILIVAMIVLAVLFVVRGVRENEQEYQTRNRHRDLIDRYVSDGYDMAIFEERH